MPVTEDINREFEQYGLSDYERGGRYGPDNMAAYMQQQLGAMPQMQAPSVGAAQQYGYGAMDMAGRGAAIQAGHAAQGMGGMNPAARAAAMAQISQGAGAQMGQAGVQGMMQGGGWLQQAGMQNYQGAMQNRGMQANAIGQALQQGYGARLGRYQSARDESMRRMQHGWDVEAKKKSLWGTVGQVAGGIGGFLLGGPPGAMAGSQLGGIVGGAAGGDQQQQMGGGNPMQYMPGGGWGQQQQPTYQQYAQQYAGGMGPQFQGPVAQPWQQGQWSQNLNSYYGM